MVHRLQRARNCTDGAPIDLDSHLHRLAPQEGNFGRRRLHDKLRTLKNTLEQLKGIEEALAQRGTHSSPRISDTNTADCASASQRGLGVVGSAQSGVSCAPWNKLQQFSTTTIYPTSSECQRRGGLIPAQSFEAYHHQPQSGMAPLDRSAVQDQYSRDMRSVDARNVPAPGPPCRNARAFVEVELDATSVRPAARRQTHTRVTADGRVVAVDSLTTSYGDHAPSVYPGEAKFGEQEEAVWASTLAGNLVPAESASVLVDIGCDSPGADSWASEVFASSDSAQPRNMHVVDIWPTSQPDPEGARHTLPPSDASDSSMLVEQWGNSPSLPPLSADVMKPDFRMTSYEGRQAPVSTYSSLEGAVPA